MNVFRGRSTLSFRSFKKLDGIEKKDAKRKNMVYNLTKQKGKQFLHFVKCTPTLPPGAGAQASGGRADLDGRAQGQARQLRHDDALGPPRRDQVSTVSFF